jgi:hypothetical protein
VGNAARKRKKYRDKVKVPSRLIKFIPGESAPERHARRLAFAMSLKEQADELCKRAGLTLEIKNDGHHWIFRKGAKVAEWWPSSAKLVINKKWRKGIHVHDPECAIGEALRRLT